MSVALKYHNVPTVYKGIRYQSKKEANHAFELDLALRSGQLLEYKRQVPFELIAGIKYIVDFVEKWETGELRYVDVKGYKTDVYKLKKKIVEFMYKIKITEV
jgi:hypothetical protein